MALLIALVIIVVSFPAAADLSTNAVSFATAALAVPISATVPTGRAAILSTSLRSAEAAFSEPGPAKAKFLGLAASITETGFTHPRTDSFRSCTIATLGLLVPYVLEIATHCCGNLYFTPFAISSRARLKVISSLRCCFIGYGLNAVLIISPDPRVMAFLNCPIRLRPASLCMSVWAWLPCRKITLCAMSRSDANAESPVPIERAATDGSTRVPSMLLGSTRLESLSFSPSLVSTNGRFLAHPCFAWYCGPVSWR